MNGIPDRDSVIMEYIRFLDLAYPSYTFVIEEVSQQTAAIGTHEDIFPG
jgi:hypothetical protein